MQIDHDPREPKIDRGNGIFYIAWAIVAVGWVLLWFGGHEFDWPSVAAGAASALVLIITVNEKVIAPRERKR